MKKDGMQGDGKEGMIGTYETFAAIVETLKSSEGAKAAEVAEKLGISISSAYRHLNTLETLEYVTKVDGVYQLGFRFLDIGGHVRHTHKLYLPVRPKVRQIAERTGELCRFMIADHGYGVIVCRDWGSDAVWTDGRVGKRYNLHQTAAGKAILANFPDDEVERIIDRYGLPSETEQTISDRDSLYTDLETMDKKGCTFDMGEHVEKLWGVGVPIMDEDGVMGGLSVLGPAHRMQGEWFDQEIPDMLQGIVDEIELNIQYEVRTASR